MKSNCQAEVSSSADVSYDKTESTTGDGTTISESIGEDFNIEFNSNINEVLDYTANFSLGLVESSGTEQFNDNSLDTQGDFALNSLPWAMSFGVTQSVSSSDDPTVDKATTTGYFADLTLSMGDIFPDMLFSTSRDESYTPGSTDTVDTALDFSTQYDIEFLDMTVDYSFSKSISKNNLIADSTTKDLSYTWSTSLSQEFTESLSYSFNYSNTKTLSFEYFDDGSVKNNTGSRSWNANNALDFKVSQSTQVSSSLDFSKNVDLISQEKDFSTNRSADISQDVVSWISVSVSFSGDVSETLDTPSDSVSTAETLSISTNISPNDFFDIAISTNDNKTKNDSKVDTQDSISSSEDIDFSWDATISEDFSFTYDVANSKSYSEGVLDSDDDSMKFSANISGIDGAGLQISPSYSWDKKQDLFLGVITSKSESLSISVDYEMKPSTNIDLIISHSYSRSKDLLTFIIGRSDDSSLTLDLTEPIKELNFSFGVARQSSDTSDDDEGPITDFSYDFSTDWAIGNTSLSLTYTFDDPQEGVNSESLTIGLNSTFLTLADLSMNYSFSQDLGEEVSKNNSFSISLSMNF